MSVMLMHGVEVEGEQHAALWVGFWAYRVELEAVGVAGPLSILWQQLEYLSMCLTDRHL